MKRNYQQRSTAMERIDTPEAIPADEMRRTLEALRAVNRWLGGAQACLAPTRAWMRSAARRNGEGAAFRLLDLGCGGADILIRLVRWSRRRRLPLRIIALDLNGQACRAALEAARGFPEIAIVQADAFRLPFLHRTFDLVLCSTFLHHIDDRRLITLLKDLKAQSRQALVVNDLHRHPAAYWGIRLLSSILGWCPTVRHDGPLSVLKAFRRPELDRALRKAGMERCSIRWRWAFRWSVLAPCQPQESDQEPVGS